MLHLFGTYPFFCCHWTLQPLLFMRIIRWNINSDLLELLQLIQLAPKESWKLNKFIFAFFFPSKACVSCLANSWCCTKPLLGTKEFDSWLQFPFLYTPARVGEITHSSVSPDYQKALVFTVQTAKLSLSGRKKHCAQGHEIKGRCSEGAKMVWPCRGHSGEKKKGKDMVFQLVIQAQFQGPAQKFAQGAEDSAVLHGLQYHCHTGPRATTVSNPQCCDLCHPHQMATHSWNTHKASDTTLSSSDKCLGVCAKEHTMALLPS